MYTAEQMQARIGASTILFPAEHRIGAREISMIREAGLTQLEVGGFNPRSHFDYRDKAQVKEIVDE